MSHSGNLNAGRCPSFMHCSFTLYCSSSSTSPPCSCAFCARTVVAQHFIASRGALLIMPAASISSIQPCRNCVWGGISAHWWTCSLNFVPSGMLRWCIAPGTGMTSANDPVKISTYWVTRASAC